MLERLRWPLTGAILLALAAFAIWGWQARPRSAPLDLQVADFAATRAARVIAVYVTGEVERPGVYTFSGEMRVADAIERAGGATADADLTNVNLATRLRDELHVDVPRIRSAAADGPAGTVVAAADATPLPASVNLNSATVAELATLPGIGDVTAARIVAHREENGPFGSLEALRATRILSASAFKKAAPYLVAP